MATIESFAKKVLLVAQETTYGTDAVPTATDAVLMLNGTISTPDDKLERNIDSVEFQSSPFVLTGARVQLQFEVEIVGGGVVDTPPAIGPLLIASGLAETITPTSGPVSYDPISTGVPSFTCYFQIGNYFWKVLGSQAYFTANRSIRNYGKLNVTIMGLFVTPVDQAPPTPDFTGWRDPLPIESDNWDVTLNSVALNVKSNEFNLGNSTPYYEGSEIRQFHLIDRQPSGTLTVFAPPIATINLYDLAATHAKVPLIDTHGTVAGDITEFNFPKVQLSKPEPTDVGDNAFGFRIPYTVLETAYKFTTQ